MTERAYTNDEIAELEGLRASIKAIDDAPVERYRAALAVLRGDPAQVVDQSEFQTLMIAEAHERYPQANGHSRPAFIAGAKWAKEILPSTPQAGVATAWRVWWVSLNTARTELFEVEAAANERAREVGGCVIPLYTAPPSQAGTAQSELVAPDNLSEQLRHIAAWAESGISIRDHIDKLYMAANEIARLKAVAVPASQAGMREARPEEIAMEIALSYGRDPDEPAPIMEMCDENNDTVPIWMVYVEQAEAILAKYKVTARAALQSSQPEAGEKSDGAIYAEVSQRNMTADEKAGIERALRDSGTVLYDLSPSSSGQTKGDEV